MTCIDINVIRKSYSAVAQAKAHLAIENLQFSVHKQEFVCLVGPSGCGKTTLLNIIAGLDREGYEGEIRFNQGANLKPKIGYVFQNPRLLPWRTVRENIELALEHQSASLTIDELLESMQLSNIQQHYPERLSLGMSRRVAIVRAFAINPDLLLMDEPFVSIDAPTARQIRSLLLQLWQDRPHCVLFVTHDLREAIALADRIIFLSSPPMHLLSDVPVPIPRAERNETQIEQVRQQLLTNQPEIQMLL